jgi:dihydrofolate reductase
MRKLVVFNLITLDGYFEGPNREIDWHNVDSEFNVFAIQQLDSTDLLLFGRITYELMAGYWPTETAVKNDPVVAGKMNNITKIVFSKTLSKAEWNNTRVVKNNIEKEVVKLKQQTGKDMFIFGSGSIVSHLTNLGLIDQFGGIANRYKLKLKMTRAFRNGNILLYYEKDVK